MTTPQRTPKGWYGVAVVVAVTLVLVARQGGTPADAACPAGPSITVVSSSEKAGLLTELARDYASAARRVDGACGVVTVVAKSSGEAASTLVAGWDETVDGPLPTVWTPVTSSWLEIARERLAERDGARLIPDEVGHVATSSLVIAMPRPMAEAMGWPDDHIGWHDLFELAQAPHGWARYGHPEWGAFELGKTNPNFSTSGLNALIGEYYAATGTSSDLTVNDIRDPKVIRFVRGVESSVVHYGDISITFLENLRRADDAGEGMSYVSAVAIEEKSVLDYNLGNPSGDPDTLGLLPPPTTPLAAVYPEEGTMVNDHPYAILDAPWVNEAARVVAEDFLAFVQAPAQQARFQAAGFRDHSGTPGDRIRPSNGLLPDQPTAVLGTPSAEVLDAIQGSWDTVRKRARVLLVLDVSGSMEASVGSEGRTKLELAKDAALTALDGFAPDDRVGVWAFSSGSPPWWVLAPVSPLGPKEADLRAAIEALEPAGGTGLYRSVDDAAAEMVRTFDPASINGVVVLTDGMNDDVRFSSVDPLLEHLRDQPADRPIRVFCIAYGEDADIDGLRQISDASLGATYDASESEAIEDVFAAVLSNF